MVVLGGAAVSYERGAPGFVGLAPNTGERQHGHTAIGREECITQLDGQTLVVKWILPPRHGRDPSEVWGHRSM